MLSGLEELVLFGFVPLMVGVLVWPNPSGTGERMLTGKIVIALQQPLPDGALATVELIEQRRGEAFLPVVARETRQWRGQGSQKFSLRVDPNLIQPSAHYGLRARIVVEGVVQFETPYPQPAALLASEQVTLTLVPAAARPR